MCWHGTTGVLKSKCSCNRLKSVNGKLLSKPVIVEGYVHLSCHTSNIHLFKGTLLVLRTYFFTNIATPDVRSKLCFQGHSKVTFWHRVYWKLSFCVTSSVYFRGDSEIVDWRDIGAQWKLYFGDTLNWMDLGWILELHCFAWRVGGIPDVGCKSQNMVSHVLDCY